MNDEDIPLPWERLPDETAAEYSLFVLYRKADVVWRHLSNVSRAANAAGFSGEALKELAARHRWDERAGLHDENVLAEADIKARRMVFRAMRDKAGTLQIRIAIIVLERILKRLMDDPEKILDAAEASALAAAGSKLGEKVLDELTAKVGLVDANLAERLRGAKSLEELNAIARECGLEGTPDG